MTLDYKISQKLFCSLTIKIVKDIISSRFFVFCLTIPLTSTHEVKYRASQERYILGHGCKEYLK